MILKGIVLHFSMEESESLKPLIEEAGYSAPAKDIPAKKTYPSSGGVEIERKTKTSAFVTIHLSPEDDMVAALFDLQEDLVQTGLVK
jgi:hypothetical protein